MFVSRCIDANHKDLIHDVAYDFYGRRMATCSSDQVVKVWDVGEDGQWQCTSSWKAHSGSVWKVTWAHPEFGQVIATCSFDRTAIVWEEIVGDSRSSVKTQSQWIKRTSLVDSRTSITDVRFGPRHLGLQLATCSIDGIVRVYDAPDVMNLSQWPLQYEFSCKLTCSCIAWNHSRIHPPMIAIGSDDSSPNSGGKVLVFEFGETSRRWQRVETLVSFTEPVHDLAFAPNLGRSYHLLAVACQEVSIVLLKPIQRESLSSSVQGMSRFEIRQVGQFSDHSSTVYRVSWNITGTILASSGDDGSVRLWKANYLDIWKCIAVIKGKSLNVQPAISTGTPATSSTGKH